MTKKIVMTSIIAITMVIGLFAAFPNVYASPPETTLEQKCADQNPEKPKSPDCELLEIINTLEAELDAKDMALMDADAALQAALDAEIAARTAADVDLQAQLDAEVAARIAKDDTLMSTDSELLADVSVLCTNTPVLKTSVQIVGGATSDLLTAVNDDVLSPLNMDVLGFLNTHVIGGLNTNLITPVEGFNTGFTLDIPDPSIPVPTVSVGTTNIDVCPAIDLGIVEFDLNCNVPLPTVNVGSTNVGIPIPPFSVPGIEPFDGLPTVPSVPTIPLVPSNTIQSVDSTVATVQNCPT